MLLLQFRQPSVPHWFNPAAAFGEGQHWTNRWRALFLERHFILDPYCAGLRSKETIILRLQGLVDEKLDLTNNVCLQPQKPGLHQKQCGQQGEEYDSAPLLCFPGSPQFCESVETAQFSEFLNWNLKGNDYLLKSWLKWDKHMQERNKNSVEAFASQNVTLKAYRVSNAEDANREKK